MDLQVLREIDLFANLSQVHLSHLASIMEEAKYDKEEVIFREDDEALDFYVIYRGRVRISRVLGGMGEEALAILDKGTYFGEMELIDNDKRLAQATAHEDCILHTFKYSDFHDLLRTDNELALAITWNIVRTLSNRLRETSDKVAATFAMAQFQ